MQKVRRFIRGNVRVYLSGFAPERFMNLCTNHGIELWNVKPVKDGYEFNMTIKSFFESKNMLKKTRTKVVIRKKLGLPFLMYRYRKRKFFFFGFLFCIILLFLMTKFVWAFQISGNRQFTHDMFTDFLEEQHITYGMPLQNIDIDQLEKNLRQEYDYITWASVKLEGTKMHVTIKENEHVENLCETTGTGDIVSTVSGNIISIITRNGIPKVKVGDNVEKGQILISGILPIMNDDLTIRAFHQVLADGDILIESNMSYVDELNLNYKNKIYGENKRKHYVVGFGDKELEIGFKNFESPYEMTSFRNNIKILDNLYLPLVVGHNEYAPYILIDEKYTKEEAKEILTKNYISFCSKLQEKGIQIIQKNVKIDYYQEKVIMNGTLIVEGNSVQLIEIASVPEIATMPEDIPIE